MGRGLVYMKGNETTSHAVRHTTTILYLDCVGYPSASGNFVPVFLADRIWGKEETTTDHDREVDRVSSGDDEILAWKFWPFGVMFDQWKGGRIKRLDETSPVDCPVDRLWVIQTVVAVTLHERPAARP